MISLQENFEKPVMRTFADILLSQRILTLVEMSNRWRTVSQIAELLGEKPSNIAYNLYELNRQRQISCMSVAGCHPKYALILKELINVPLPTRQI